MQVHAERQNWCTVREHTWNCAEEIGQVLVWNQTKPAGGFQVTWATVVCGGYAGYQSDKQNEAMIKKGCRETAGSQALRVARWVVDAARRQPRMGWEVGRRGWKWAVQSASGVGAWHAT